MIKKHYALFDTTAQNFHNTLVFQNHGEAIRWFTTVVNDKDNKENLIAKYPTQFMLFYMFDIDDKTGFTGHWNVEKQEMEKQKPPQELIIGASCVEEANKAFTVRELITMLKAELGDNVIKLTEEVVNK
jgi:hypothetical protein